MRRIIPYISILSAFVMVGLILIAIVLVGASYEEMGSPNPVAVLLTSGFFLFVSHLAYADRAIFRKSLRSLRWVRTDATITAVEDNSFYIDSVSQYTPARVTKFSEIKCTYKYHVKGDTYHGDRYSFGGNVDQGWTRLSPGDRISIYYDKNDFAQSVVLRGASPTLWFSPVVAVGTLASIIWMYVRNAT